MVNSQFWPGKKVLLTGHTGFKGSWLALWLHLLGAKLVGYSLPRPTSPSLFDLLDLQGYLVSIEGDVRDFPHLEEVIQTHRPEIIFHLAAQSLVRRSYGDPRETYSTNIMGTVNVLEAVRRSGGKSIIVNVTSDKCYDNREWAWGYREIDRLGGFSPYASSKGCVELITAAYRDSFFPPQEFQRHGVALASVRAGNVIGGGDWAEDRLIPDLIRGFLRQQVVRIRYPAAERPWQHVLEPLRGYLILAKKLFYQGESYSEAWNFGPRDEDVKPVSWVVERLAALWGPEGQWQVEKNPQAHEDHLLKLDCSKARMRLGWHPRLHLDQALAWTVAWYKAFQKDPATLLQVTESQIEAYQNLMADA